MKQKQRNMADEQGPAPLTKSLLPQCQFLQLLQAVLLGRTVDDGILEQIAIHATAVHGAFDTAIRRGRRHGLQLPRVAALVMEQPREVVTLVEVLEHRAEDLRLLVG